MAKLKMTSTVVSQEMIATDIYSLWLRAEEIAVQAKPGQFISVYCKDSGKILPRPISICEIDKEKGMLRIVYRIAGEGTKEFSSLVSGDTIDILGPLGNGFPMEEVKGKKSVYDGWRNWYSSNGTDCKRSRSRCNNYCRLS